MSVLCLLTGQTARGVRDEPALQHVIPRLLEEANAMWGPSPALELALDGGALFAALPESSLAGGGLDGTLLLLAAAALLLPALLAGGGLLLDGGGGAALLLAAGAGAVFGD